MPQDERPRLLVVGPTPPPVHGVSAYMAMLVSFLPLRAQFRVRHLDTSDRRPIDTIGRVDLTNVMLGIRHLGAMFEALWVHRPALTLIPVSQNAPAFLRDALFVAMARGAGSRVILHLHGGAFAGFYRDAPGWLRGVIRWTHRRVHKVWVLGEGLRGQYDGLVPAGRVRVVPNGVADLWGRAGVPDRAESRAKSGFRILFLGQLSMTKGADVLLDSIDMLCSRRVEFRLVVAGAWGTPLDQSRLKPRLDDLAERGLVEHHGVVAGDQKTRLLADADAFVLVSTAPEGMPLAILEAMAAGLPVVATPQGAVVDVVEDHCTGFLVPPGDATALTNALERLADDPVLGQTLGAAARARYLERFTARQALDGAVGELVHARK